MAAKRLVNFRLEEDLWEKLLERAAESHSTPSDLLRAMVRRGLAPPRAHLVPGPTTFGYGGANFNVTYIDGA